LAQGAISLATSQRPFSDVLEGMRVPVSMLEGGPLWGQCMSKFLRRTWSLVVNLLRVYHLYEFLRDHYDNQR